MIACNKRAAQHLATECKMSQRQHTPAANGCATALWKVGTHTAETLRSLHVYTNALLESHTVPMTPSLRTLIQESHYHLEQGLLQAFPDKTCLLKTADAEASSETLLSTTEKLHISLTRPFTVRAHERDEYVKTALAEIGRLSTGMAR